MTPPPSIAIRLASDADDLMQCFALRAAVYMGEQRCPYREEFDGNDFTASHLLLSVDGEPAACMRLRWFGAFVKFERAAILRRYRSMGLFAPFVDWAREFARSKGFSQAYLQAQQRLWPLMEREGFRRLDARTFHFSDHAYGAFTCDLAVDPGAPSISDEPLVLNRREDRRHLPGILDGSVERGATNPHVPWAGRGKTI